MLAAAALLLGQYAAFRGALPFPQFLAFIAVGIAALAHRAGSAATAGHCGHTGPGQALSRHYIAGADDQPSQL